MNAQWDTPPDGDFARYVETLAAQVALQRRAAEARGGVEAGMPVPGASQGSASDRFAGIGGTIVNAANAPAPRDGSIPPWARALGIGWALLLATLLANGVAWVTIALLAGLGVWGGYVLRRRWWPAHGNRWPRLLGTAVRPSRDRPRPLP